MTTETTPTADTVPAPKRELKAVIMNVRELFKAHERSGNKLLAAFAHPDITDEQIIAMARSYGACRRGLRESMTLMRNAPKVRASMALSALVESMKWPPTK